MTQRAFINKDVLRWAMDRAGARAANEVGERWLDRDAHPTVRQAQALAKKLAIPFGYFFLSGAPAADDLPLPDLRTRDNRPPPLPSLDLREQLDWITAKQQWYAEFRRSQREDPIAFVGAIRNHPAADAARQIEATFQLAEVRAAAGGWSDYLTRLCRRAESLGVLVMRSGVVAMANRRHLDADEFQGFAIADPMAPAIFINTADFVTATIFTFAHELAHVWLGQSGITLNDEGGTQQPRDVERLCNSIAAELLVPTEELQGAWRAQPVGEQTQRLARAFKVSTTVVLRRALDTRRISRQEFFAQLDVERERQREAPVRRPQKGGSGVNNILARNGHLLAHAAVAGALEGRVGYAEAAAALGVKVQTLRNLAKPLGLE